MSLRIKLVLSYLVMGFMPILLIVGIIGGVIVNVINSNPVLTSVTDGPEGAFVNGLDSILNLELMVRDASSDWDIAELEEISKQLSTFHIGFLVTDTTGNVFFQSDTFDAASMLKRIQAVPNTSGERVTPGTAVREHMMEMHAPLGYKKLLADEGWSIFEKTISKPGMGKLYVILETGSSSTATATFVKRFAAGIFWLTAILILLLTFFVTRSMMQSLRKLKEGVRHIAEGDLDFSVRTRKKDEVAQVLLAFEEMRIRLKKSIAAQLKEDENRRELVANISHDLKTPVTAIKGYVEGLIDGVADTEEKRTRYLGTILSKTVSLDRMIDDLFLFSGLDTGKVPYHFATVPAIELFDGLAQELKLDLTEKGFHVSCRLDIPSELTVKADRQMLQRVQHNLTENAVKYAKEANKRADFHVTATELGITCTFEDNGKGIQAEELPHVFDRFYRADAARTSTIGGTGLGLQIAKRIVEDHEGIMLAESEYGQYTRMIWTLPVLSGGQSNG